MPEPSHYCLTYPCPVCSNRWDISYGSISRTVDKASLEYPSSTVGKVSQDRVLSGEETPKAKYLERVFEMSRESIYGDKYKEVPLLEKEMQKNSEGQMEREKVQESLEPQRERAQENPERHLERAQENSEREMEREKFKEISEREMERAQENSERQMERAQENLERRMGRAQENPERQTERAQIFESLNSLEELKDFMLKCRRVFHYVIRDPSESAKFFNFSVSEDFRLSVLDAMNCRNWEEVERLVMPIAVAFPGRAAVCHAFFISAAVLLSMVYQYLNGVIDRGGGKAYSSGSLEFRCTYVSIVLFQGAYVWIKFRDVYVHLRSYVNKDGVTVDRYEPRFKPQGSKKYISVGSFEQQDDAEKVYNLVAFYYRDVLPLGDENLLPLGNGTSFLVPRMTTENSQRTAEEERSPDKETLWRRKVAAKVKKVWDDYSTFLSFLNSLVEEPPAEHPPGPSGAVDDGDGARGEEPRDPSGAAQPSGPSGAADDGDGAQGEQLPDPHGFLHANNLMDSDDLSVEELLRQNKLLKSEEKRRNQLFQLQGQHDKERIAELEEEVARLRSKECSCKRMRTSLT